MGTGRVARAGLVGAHRLRFNLQNRILLVMLVCVVVPILLMGYYLLDQTGDVLRTKVNETVVNHLHRRAEALDALFALRAYEVKSWSGSFALYENIELLERGAGDPGSHREEMSKYLESVAGNNTSFDSLFAVDRAGNVLASTREGDQLEDWARDLLQSQPKGGLISPLRRSDALGQPSLLVMHAISPQPEAAESTNKKVIGYVIGRIRVSDLERELSSTVGENEPDYWLLDEHSKILVQGGRIVNDPGQTPFPAPPPDLKEGEDAEAPRQGDLPGLGSTVYARRVLKERPWYVAATVSAPGAFRLLDESRKRLMKAGAPAVLVIFILAYVLARGLLRPILLLSEGAQRVSAGDLDVHLPVRGRDELADLTSAFNDMARRVRESRDQLAETASALARSNEQLEQAKERFRAQAITDALTGLFNRRHFEDTLEQQIERATAESWPLSLLLLDLDHFKQYNDRWGHTEGDSELRRVAALVQRTVRSTDIAFRYGGEELAVLLPSCAKDQAVGVAEKVRQAVGSGTQRPTRFGARTTVSVGVATFPEDGRVARGLVDTADAALYQAKALGRDRVVAAGGPSGGGPMGDERAAG
jgi:diguanylate cyclase (GGDEF)-like protein